MIRKTAVKRALALVALLCIVAAFLPAQVHIREKIQIRPLQAVRMQSGPSVTHRLRVVVQWDQPWFARLDTYTPCGLRSDTGTSHISFTIDPAPGGSYPHFILFPNRPAGQTAHAIFELYYDDQLVYRDSTVYGQFSNGWPDAPYNTPHYDGFHLTLPHDPVFYEEGTMGEVTGFNQCGSTTSWTPSTDSVTLSIASGSEYGQFWNIVDDFFGPRIPMGSSITVLASELQHYRLAADGFLPDSQGVWVSVLAESNGIEQLDSIFVVPYFLKFEFDPDSIQAGQDSRVVIRTVDAQGEEHFRPVGPLVTVGLRDSTNYGTLRYQYNNGSVIAQGDTVNGVETLFISDGGSGIELRFLANESTPSQTFPVTLFANKTDEGSSYDQVFAIDYPFAGRDTVSGSGRITLVAEPGSLDHFKVTLEKDTVAYSEATKIFVQAQDSNDQDIEFEDSNLLTFSIDSALYGSFINVLTDTVPSPLRDVLYSDAQNGNIRFAAVNKNPDSLVNFKVAVKLQPDTAKTGDTTLVLLEQTLKIVMNQPYQVRPSIPTEDQDTAKTNLRKKSFEVRMTRGGKSVPNHPFRLFTNYVELSGGHAHNDTRTATREDNDDNYGYFLRSGQSNPHYRPMEEVTNSEGRFPVTYYASMFGDTMRIHVKSRSNPLLVDSIGVVEEVDSLINFRNVPANSRGCCISRIQVLADILIIIGAHKSSLTV